eukprot:1122309-Rhodomonas_salina.1
MGALHQLRGARPAEGAAAPGAKRRARACQTPHALCVSTRHALCVSTRHSLCVSTRHSLCVSTHRQTGTR